MAVQYLNRSKPISFESVEANRVARIRTKERLMETKKAKMVQVAT